MRSRDVSETLYRVIGSIYRYVEDLTVLEYPRKLHRRSIDVAMRLSDGRLALVKVADNLNNVSKQDVQELRDIASTLKAGALIVADYAGEKELLDDVAYDIYNVKAVNTSTLENVLSGESNVYVYQSGDIFKARIDGAMMRKKRLEKGLSLGDVAYRIGVTRKAVYDYERGYIEPTIDKAEKLVELLGEEILAPLDIFECVREVKTSGYESQTFDSRNEEVVARILRERNFRVIHAKRTTVDIVGSREDKKISLVIRHGRESFESLKLKSVNARRLSRIASIVNYVIVDDRSLVRDLESEGIEVRMPREFIELIEEDL